MLDIEHDFAEDHEETLAMSMHWINEKTSESILPFQSETVANIMELLENQSSLLEDKKQNNINTYTECLYEMEMERIKFLLASYLRCRLDKIRSEVMSKKSIKLDLMQQNLSEQEWRYLTCLQNLKSQYLHGNLSSRIPESLWTQDDRYEEKTEAIHYVPCRVLEDVGSIEADTRGLIIDLKRGDIFVLKQDIALQLLVSGKIQLL